jgi:hypothetical protein
MQAVTQFGLAVQISRRHSSRWRQNFLPDVGQHQSSDAESHLRRKKQAIQIIIIIIIIIIIA